MIIIFTHFQKKELSEEYADSRWRLSYKLQLLNNVVVPATQNEPFLRY